MLLRTIYLLASGNSKCNLQNVGSCLRGQSICSHLAIVNLSRIFRCSLIAIILISEVAQKCPQHQNISVVIVFVLSWLPLNLYNLITDLLKALQGQAEIMLMVILQGSSTRSNTRFKHKVERSIFSFRRIDFCQSNANATVRKTRQEDELQSLPERSRTSSLNLFQVFAACHMMGILSAIANPLLYGYFNQVKLCQFY